MQSNRFLVLYLKFLIVFEDIVYLRKIVGRLVAEPFFNRKETSDLPPKKSFSTMDEILGQVVENLKICITRFPQHYKSYYRLATLAVSKNDYKSAVRILVDSTQSKPSVLDSLDDPSDIIFFEKDFPALFGERTRTNFFAGIWRTPSGDIDRPGSFSRHLARCCELTIKDSILIHWEIFSVFLEKCNCFNFITFVSTFRFFRDKVTSRSN